MKFMRRSTSRGTADRYELKQSGLNQARRNCASLEESLAHVCGES
jgi:hypothetical protein